MEEKKQRQRNENIQKHSSIIDKQSMISMKIWKTIIQKRKVLIVFNDMTADLEANKKSSPIVFELFQEAEYRNLISKCLKL